MAISTPTIKETQQRIIADIEGQYSQTIPLLAKAVFRVMSYVYAGVIIILYKYGTDQFRQRFVQTANEFWLSILGELVGVFRQNATTWNGVIDVISTTTTTLNVGSQLVNNDTGVVYLVSGDTAITPGTIAVLVFSTVGGSIGNLEADDEIAFAKPLPGISDIAVVSSTAIVGEDKEDIEIYRQRVLDRYQKKPQGGALADYELWSEEAPNVINAYPYANATPGIVDIYTEVDNQTDGIPTAPQLVIVESYIDFDPDTGIANRRPVQAQRQALPITRIGFDIEITGLNPDTPDNRTAIESSLDSLFLGKAPFVEGLTVTRNDTITQAEAVSVAQRTAALKGAIVTGVNVDLVGVFTILYVLASGEKSKVLSYSYL